MDLTSIFQAYIYIVMSFTRKYDDTAIVTDRLHQMRSSECYMLQTPGNGTRPCYVSDPHIRLQKWGGNLRESCINIDNGLRGLGAPLIRDCIDKVASAPKGMPITYPTCSSWTDETRATNPAWQYRTVTRDTTQLLFCDPQKDADKRLWNQTSTRDQARDEFERKGICTL